jgi:hypothetical protein
MEKASATYAQLQLSQSKCAKRNKEIKACIWGPIAPLCPLPGVAPASVISSIYVKMIYLSNKETLGNASSARTANNRICW